MNLPESEYIERAALRDVHDAAADSDTRSLGIQGGTLGSAFLSMASRLPDSAIVINRVIGLGLETEASRGDVHTLVSTYRDKGVKRYFVQLHPDHSPTRITKWLLDEGLGPGRGWQKFSRKRDPVTRGRCDLAVREIDQLYGAEFGKIICDAFDLGDQAAPWLSRIPGRPDWHIFMSFDGDRAAGVGALYVKDGLAWTDFGATSPAFRRRGSQGEIMAARLERALDLGCRKIFTCTGVNVPGDPQHSYSNILKAGFVEEYVRENYEPV